MDANQLFWATGIDNTKLNTNVNEAVAIFQKLSNNVKAELEKIERYYDKVQLKANLKFTNPVDPSMVASIREQMASLGKVIDDQTNRVANLSLTYDKAMSKISSSASKLGKGGSSSSPIKESIDNVKADVARADKELSFLEKRFKYAASSIIAYGSFRWGKQFIDDMISVKGEFDQLRVAIDAFVGSSEKGAEIFGQLTRLAVKSPFELRDITNSAKQLLAYGTAADDVTNSVKMLSDVSAGSGQSIKDIAYLYGTSLTQGRLYARDLFQFANRGIPIYGELAKVMGISTEKLMQMTKAGKVGFPELQKAIENMTAAGGKYYGLSDKLAETTYGKISNLKDKWSIALNEMGTQTDGIVSTGVEGITKLIANWEEVAKAIEGVVLAYGSYKAAMAVGLLIEGAKQLQLINAMNVALGVTTKSTNIFAASWSNLGKVIASNPYTAAAVALGVLVFAVWEMRDSTTAAESATKKFNESMDSISKSTEDSRKKFEDLLNTVKNKTAGDIAQIEAYEELKRLYPDIIKGMSIQKVMLMDSTKAQKEYNDQLAYNEVIQKRILAIESKRRLESARQYLEDVKSTPQRSYADAAALQSAQKSFDTAQILYDRLQKEADKASKTLHSARKYASEHVVKNKAYWEEIKSSAKSERDALDKSQENGKEWNRLLDIERNADKQLSAWDSSSKMDKRSASAKTKAQKEAERQAKLVQEQNRLNNEILQNQEKLADASKQAELDRAQADIDILEDGYAKKQAQIEANYNREIAKVKEKGDELLKVQQEIAYDQWLVANPNWAKEKKSFTMPTTLSTENKATVTSLTGTAEMNRANESKKIYEKLLIDLQNFDQQRIEIDKKYNDQVAYLNNKRVDDNKIDLKNITDENKYSTDKRIQDRNIETDKAIAEAERLAKEAKAKISIDELQKEINWGDVFSDLDKMSTDSLTKVRDKIKVIISNINGDASKVDIKEIIKALDSIDEKLSERDSINAMKTAIDEYSKATKKAAASQALLNKLSKEGKKGTKEYKDAEEDLEKNQNDRVKASAKMTKSFEDIKKKTDGLSSSFKSLGDSIGGALGEGFTVAAQIIDITMQGISGVVSLVNMSAAAMTTTATTASTAMQTIEKASVVLAIISAAIQLATTIANLLNGKSRDQKYYEKLKKELEDYLSVLDKTIESQKEFLNTLNGYEASAASKEIVESIEKQIEAYRKLAEAAGNAGGELTSNVNLQLGKTASFAERLAGLTGVYKNIKSLGFEGFSKWAGTTIDEVSDLYTLTPEQLKKVRDNNSYAWSLISEDIRGYLDNIITAGEAIEDSVNSANEAFLGLSFDSAKDSLDDLLKSADTTMADIAGNFEDYMRNSMLSIIKGRYLTNALHGWYDKFVADTTSGNELTNEEVDSLRQAYIDIYENAQSQYDALLDAADITLTNSSNSTSGAISSMSQESADILTAQFSAIRINVSDILLTLQSERPLFELAFNDIAEIARNTRDLADIKRLIGDIKDYGVKMK